MYDVEANDVLEVTSIAVEMLHERLVGEGNEGALRAVRTPGVGVGPLGTDACDPLVGTGGRIAYPSRSLAVAVGVQVASPDEERPEEGQLVFRRAFRRDKPLSSSGLTLCGLGLDLLCEECGTLSPLNFCRIEPPVPIDCVYDYRRPAVCVGDKLDKRRLAAADDGVARAGDCRFAHASSFGLGSCGSLTCTFMVACLGPDVHRHGAYRPARLVSISIV